MSAELWTRDASMRYLNEYPLPRGFMWKHRDGGIREVWPRHRFVTGYGKWLRETPYFMGLFELIHGILEAAPELGDAAWLVEQIRSAQTRQKQEQLFT